MTNAFTAKPDVSWLKKAELARRNSVNSSKALNNPTANQRQWLAKVVERSEAIQADHHLGAGEAAGHGSVARRQRSTKKSLAPIPASGLQIIQMRL